MRVCAHEQEGKSGFWLTYQGWPGRQARVFRVDDSCAASVLEVAGVMDSVSDSLELSELDAFFSDSYVCFELQVT